MNALEPLYPALHKLEPLGLTAGMWQEWYAYANQKQAARLAKHLEQELESIYLQYAAQVDHAYLKSDAFQANVVQAVRAAEIAESEDKLRLIARALASCTLAFPAPQINKAQTMRMIEALSDREMRVFVQLFHLLDPINPYEDEIPQQMPSMGLSQQEFTAVMLGLQQLGLVIQQQETRIIWKLSSLAQQVSLLCRIETSSYS